MLDYIVIQKNVFSELQGSKAYHVLSVLLFNRNTSTNHSHFMTKREIAMKAGVSTRYVYDALILLEGKGLIQFIAERRGEYMYHILCLEGVERSEAEVEVDIQQMMKNIKEI